MEKVAIGEKLFFDTILSINNKISCSTCHLPSLAFTDGKRVSKGLFPLSRSAPSLLNIGFHSKGLFWDGSVSTLEKQALIPVSSSLEMGLPWFIAEKRINENDVYAKAFKVIKTNKYKTTLEVTLGDDKILEHTVTARSFNDFIDEVYNWQTERSKEHNDKMTERFNTRYATK